MLHASNVILARLIATMFLDNALANVIVKGDELEKPASNVNYVQDNKLA